MRILIFLTFILCCNSAFASCVEYERIRIWWCGALPCATCGGAWQYCNYDSRFQSQNNCLPHGYISPNFESDCTSPPPLATYSTYEICNDSNPNPNPQTCPNVNLKIKGLPFQRIKAKLTCNQ